MPERLAAVVEPGVVAPFVVWAIRANIEPRAHQSISIYEYVPWLVPNRARDRARMHNRT